MTQFFFSNALLSAATFAFAANAQQTVTYGSSVKLHAVADNKNFYLSAISMQWNGRPQDHDIVSAMNDETRAEVFWTIMTSSLDSPKLSSQPVFCGSSVRFSQAVSGKHLNSDRSFTAPLSGFSDVAATSADSPNGDFFVECESDIWRMGDGVSLRHAISGGYLGVSSGLSFNEYNCQRCPMNGDLEVSVSEANARVRWVVGGGVIIHELQELDAEDPRTRQSRDEL